MEQPQIKTEETKKVLSSVEQFKKFTDNTIALVNFEIPFQKTEEDYIIYRGKDWQTFPKLKTFLCIPGSAFVDHNRVIYDVTYPGILSFLPPGYQIIVLLHPVAPQHKFPEPLLHLERTIPHLLENSEQYLIDRENVIFGGYSSGAIMLIPLAIAFAKKGIVFRNVVSMGALYDFTEQVRSQEQAKKWEPYQSKDLKSLNSFVAFINEHYSRSAEDLLDPRYSPTFTSPQDLSFLKNFVIIYGENDFMRGTIEAFKAKLSKAGTHFQDEMIKEHGHGILVLFKNKHSVLSEEGLKNLIEKRLESVRHIALCIKRLSQ